MKLDKIIEGLEVVKVIGKTDVEISEIKIDSGSVSDNCLFICINGTIEDGHNYVKEAEYYGAKAVVVEKEVQTNLVQIIVKNTRIAMSKIASNFYNNPSKDLKLIGITGTNGKTTTTFIIKSILDSANIKCGVIGTLGAFWLDKKEELSLTTPDPLELHRLFYLMKKDGVSVVVMEVSAHALDLHKVDNIYFDVSILTNVTQDHLDYFKNMQNYKLAKSKLFKKEMTRYSVINSDDSFGRKLIKELDFSVSYGLKNPSDIFAIKVRQNNDKTSFVINLFDAVYNVKTSLIGEFNVYNVLASATACALIGVKVNDIILGINNTESVNGRLEKVYDKEIKIFIDYAHTPDGLKNSIKALKKNKKGRLICVFGCGGNRDKTKRPLMGEISGRYADFTILTSDNPRFEEPMDIIFSVESGLCKKTKNYVIVENRKEAIKYAINYARKGDVILIAGKGSEMYQEVFGIKHPFNDKDIIKQLVSV